MQIWFKKARTSIYKGWRYNTKISLGKLGEKRNERRDAFSFNQRCRGNNLLPFKICRISQRKNMNCKWHIFISQTHANTSPWKIHACMLSANSKMVVTIIIRQLNYTTHSILKYWYRYIRNHIGEYVCSSCNSSPRLAVAILTLIKDMKYNPLCVGHI